MINLFSKLSGKVKHLKRGVAVFENRLSQPTFIQIAMEDVIYKELTGVESLNTYQIDDDRKKDYAERFKQKEVFCLLEKDQQIISYGWVNQGDMHIIGELGINIDLDPETEVLYDFATHENFRGKNLYPYLLQRICNRNGKKKMIYALVQNKASIKGISKAGFRFLGNVYGYNRNKAIILFKS